ncbi:MAG TPA: prephenate dehydrogenase/arogenate dehydrogenase family protein [Methylophilaceae bacterium]|nr:prephenate dehydrogenase/arogenate dehydrogenase family protein [Methylophilaceae bacterium]
MNKLVIFGVGLIGGSLALALKRQGYVHQIVGVGRKDESLQTALDLKVIDAAEADPAIAVADADMVVIATPVAQTASIFTALAPHLHHNTIVTDVGSTKGDVIQHAAAILGEKSSQFVPGHPIAGAEKSGVSAARAELFENKTVVLTPTGKTGARALKQVHELWKAAGARTTEMTAAKHDSIFAAVSHLPHLLAFALVDEIAARPNAAELFSFAASGFRDFTRIAGSSPEMWRDISLANREALLTELSAYQLELAALTSLLQNSDGTGLQALFERASKARNEWAEHQNHSK